MKLLRLSLTATTKTFRHMLRNGVSPPPNVMIRGFTTASAAGNLESESKKVGEASGLLKATTEKGVEPSSISVHLIIHELVMEKKIIKAKELLAEVNRMGLALDETTYENLIHFFFNSGMSPYEVLNEMVANGFSPSVATYNSLLHEYCRGGSERRVEEAVGILRDMPERGLSPDTVSYTKVIAGFCQIAEFEKAFAMKVEMVEKGIFPDNVTYAKLIRALREVGRLPEAFDLFREMLRGGLFPDKFTYFMLMNTYCEKGEISKVFHLHDEVIHKAFLPDFVTGFSPSLVTYNALIYGLCFFKRVEEASGILRGMTEMGLSADGFSYTKVISGFCQIGEPEKAYDFKLEMDEKNIGCLDENPYESLMEVLSDEDTYSSLMNDYLAEGNFKKAYQLHCEMSQHGFLPPDFTFHVFLDGLNKKARTKEAKRHLLFMISDRCLTMPSYIAYDALIENCSNNEFKSVVGLVKGFIMRGLENEAARAHDIMLHRNYKPDGAVYNLLIFDHCRGLNVDKAYNMYKEMVHYGFDPHMFPVLALIKALYYEGRYNEMHWVIQNTLRSCNLNDSELLKVLDEIDVRKFEIHALRYVLAGIAVDSLLLDGGKCSYASASRHGRFTPTTINSCS